MDLITWELLPDFRVKRIFFDKHRHSRRVTLLKNAPHPFGLRGLDFAPGEGEPADDDPANSAPLSITPKGMGVIYHFFIKPILNVNIPQKRLQAQKPHRGGDMEEVVYSVIVFLEFDCGAEPDIW